MAQKSLKSLSDYFNSFMNDPMAFIQTYPMQFVVGLLGVGMIMKKFMPRIYRKITNIFN